MRMGKQKLKKANKKKYSHIDDLPAGNNSPKRNQPRRRRRNVTALSADDYKLRQAIEGDGTLTIIDIEADGNCLFRSLSDQLYYDYGAKHFEIRQEICDFIEGHKDDFSFFLVLDDKDAAENDEDASDFEAYVSNMRQDGDWGGHLELVAASRMYRRNITVYSARLDKFSIEHESPKKSSGPDLLLSYHDNDHYNSIRMSTASKPPPPVKTYISLNRVSPMEENTDDEGFDDDVDSSEMVLEEKATMVQSSDSVLTPTRSVSGPPETITEVEMSDVASTVQDSDAISIFPMAEGNAPVSEVDSQTANASDFVKESAVVPNEDEVQSSEEKPIQASTTMIPSKESTPFVESEEPTVDGNFKVLRI